MTDTEDLRYNSRIQDLGVAVNNLDVAREHLIRCTSRASNMAEGLKRAADHLSLYARQNGLSPPDTRTFIGPQEYLELQKEIYNTRKRIKNLESECDQVKKELKDLRGDPQPDEAK